MKKSSKINNAEAEEWFEKFYSKSFSDVTYTSIEDADEYVYFLRAALFSHSIHIRRPKGKARWPELKIFDQCCGNGSISAAMASKLGSEVLGVDLSKRAIRDARKRFSGVKKLEFKVADARKFCKDSEFDVVTCWHNSCSYSEYDAVNMLQLECMSKSLKKNGLLVIDTINKKFIEKNFIESRARVLDDGTLVGTWYKLDNDILSSTWKTCSKDNEVEEFAGMTKLYSYDKWCKILAEVGIEVFMACGSIKFDQLSDEFGRMILLGIKRKDNESNC